MGRAADIVLKDSGHLSIISEVTRLLDGYDAVSAELLFELTGEFYRGAAVFEALGSGNGNTCPWRIPKIAWRSASDRVHDRVGRPPLALLVALISTSLEL